LYLDHNLVIYFISCPKTTKTIVVGVGFIRLFGLGSLKEEDSLGSNLILNLNLKKWLDMIGMKEL